MGHIESKIKKLKDLLSIYPIFLLVRFVILRYKDLDYTQTIYLALPEIHITVFRI